MAKEKVSYSAVVAFFEDADLDLATLVYQLAGTKLEARSDAKSEFRERMKKARAGRKPKNQDAVQAGQAEQAQSASA